MGGHLSVLTEPREQTNVVYHPTNVFGSEGLAVLAGRGPRRSIAWLSPRNLQSSGDALMHFRTHGASALGALLV